MESTADQSHRRWRRAITSFGSPISKVAIRIQAISVCPHHLPKELPLQELASLHLGIEPSGLLRSIRQLMSSDQISIYLLINFFPFLHFTDVPELSIPQPTYPPSSQYNFSPDSI
ncbi:MAG TPA: hypothetical protein VGO47_09950 [Chlamydiales bacterium]|nr:hypothetical protein [Chlamydiales bacterium]